MPAIIGFGHYSRTGKDTTANYLIEALRKKGVRARKISFAWKLKDVCHQLYGWAGVREPEFYETPEGAKLRDVVLPGIELTPVQLWCKFGTDAVREKVYQNTWIDFLLKTDHSADVLIVPDVRFPNEIMALKEAGAVDVKVVRPGYGPRNTTADLALRDYRDWRYVIGESGDIEELEWWANCFADAITGDGFWPGQTDEEKQAAYAVEMLPA